MKRKLKKNQGITLIALVITIIVILIMAGVTINTITSQEGILSKARFAVDNTPKKEVVDKIKLEIVGLKAEDSLGIVTYDEIKTRLIEKGITEEELIDDETRQIITEEGYKIAIIENGTNSWNVEFVEALDSKDIIITSKLYPDAETTTPEEQITVKVIQPTDGIKKITMPDGTVKTYTGKTKKVEETFAVYVNDTYTFVIETNSGETQNYDVVISNVDVGSIAIAADQSNWKKSIDVEVMWPENRANLTQEISTNNGTSYHEYTGKETLTANTTVKARLTKNGTVVKEAEPLEISKIDREAPTGTIALSGYKISDVVLGVTATITSNDNGKSGVSYSNSKYVINKSSKALGTTASAYTGGSLTGATTTISKTKAEGTYYVHALLTDNLGNSREVISSTSQAVVGKKDFDYTGDAQSITLPVGSYQLEVWGAQGGKSVHSTRAGVGGYSIGTIGLSTKTTLYAYVGGAGKPAANSYTPLGGFNGGGNGYASGSNINDSGSGGGASDIRINSSTLYARVIVAGGGRRRRMF